MLPYPEYNILQNRTGRERNILVGINIKSKRMDLILREIHPLQGIAYFDSYYSFTQQIALRNPRVIRQFRYIYLLFLFQAVHFTYKYLHQFDPLQALVHGDYCRMAGIPAEVYLLTVGIWAQSSYFLQIIYFTTEDNVGFNVMYEILILRRRRFFNCSYAPTTSHKATCDYVRKFSIRLHYLLAQFVTFIGELVLLDLLWVRSHMT